MAVDNNDNIIIETSGLSAYVATDVVTFDGVTAHFQIMKLAHGICGAANIVSSSSPLPVTVAAGLTATISGFTGTLNVQGVVSGYPVTVSGTVTTTGLSASPLYVTTASGSRVEITGGIPLSKTTNSVSVWGPSGLTYVYVNLVDAAGNSLSYTNRALDVNITGATINATIPSTVTVVGLSGATAVNVNVGNTVGINDTNILTGMTAIYSQVVGLRADLAGLGTTIPSGFTAYRLSVTTAVTQMYSAGITCINGIQIKANSSNTDIVYINNSAGMTSGYELDPNESIFLKLQNANKIYLAAKTGSQIVSFFAS
jgi:hypothetical protein